MVFDSPLRHHRELCLSHLNIQLDNLSSTTTQRSSCSNSAKTSQERPMTIYTFRSVLDLTENRSLLGFVNAINRTA
jgi:hypothetical protein